MKSGNLRASTAETADDAAGQVSDAAPGSAVDSSVRERQPAISEGNKEEVPYGAVRSEVQNGDILCFKGKGLVSGAIRTLTKSEYSHVGLLYLFEGRKYCLEAVGQGVRLVLLSELVKSYHGGIDYFETLDVTNDQRCGAISFGFQQLGKLYDKAGIVRFFWFIVSNGKAAAEVDDIWFCSEIVCEAYRRQQVEICPMVSSYTSPHDIAKSSRVRYRYTLKPGA
jgi:uncharacterized protein YycO